MNAMQSQALQDMSRVNSEWGNWGEQPERIIRKRPRGDFKAGVLAIQRAVANYYGVPIATMREKNRRLVFSGPRQVAMALSCELTSKSLDEIGRLFSRDHSTVWHAFGQVSDRIENDPDVKLAVSEIKNDLRPAIFQRHSQAVTFKTIRNG